MVARRSRKWMWLLAVIPAAAAGVFVVGCNLGQDNADLDADNNRVAFVVDSLLKENRKLADSLDVVNAQLVDCEQARAVADSAKNKKCCSCDAKKPVVKKTTPQAPVVKKTKPKAPVVKTTAPKTPVAEQPVVVPVQVQPVTVQHPAQPVVKVIVKDNSQNNGPVVVGDNNTVNNIVVNEGAQVVVDTVMQAKRIRRIFVGYAESQNTYTK